MMSYILPFYAFLLVSSICLVHGCTHGSVRLYNSHDSSSNPHEGTVEYCYNGGWYDTCNPGWDCREANVVCRQLGFRKAVSYVSNSYSVFGYRYNLYDRHYYSCSGTETSLTSCGLYYYSYCRYYRYYYSAGVRCLQNTTTNDVNFDNCTTPGAVRLTGGTTELEGMVEYCHNNSWISICSMDDEEATVVCKQLGYQPFSRFLSSSEFSYNSTLYSPYTYYRFYCSSYASQSSLSACSNSFYSDTTCATNHASCSNPSAIRCYNSTPMCIDGALRLANGSFSQEGRVEACVNGVWSSICSNGWSTSDARVICKQLGYGDSEPVISRNAAKYGRGDGPIYFSYVNCQGWERSFTACSKTSYLHFTCSSDMYIAGTLCTDGCTEGEIRLIGGREDNEGTIEICHDNLWGLVTDAGWDSMDAQVVCRQLNMPTEGAVPVYGSRYGRPDRAIHYSYALCTGSESSLADCNKVTHSLEEGRKIYTNSQAAGVICLPSPPTPDLTCTNIKPPLVSNGEELCTAGSFRHDRDGPLEYCYKGHWTILCTLTHKEASVACAQLGYNSFTWGLISKVSYQRTNQSLIQNITCNDTSNSVQPSLNNCTVYEGSCTCKEVIGLKCFTPSNCEEGSVRIVGGVIENEGRLEVCVKGVWSSVCDQGWDKTDAHVICQQLGFSELEPEAYYGARYGVSTGPIVYSNVRCGGWENSLDECGKTNYLDFTCPQDKIAGAMCVDGCTDGSVQLVSGSSTNEGLVQICVDNIWGVISGENWDDDTAMVICRQLGFDRDIIAKPVLYPKQQRPVFLTNVTCDGTESSIGNCDKILYSFKEAKQLTLTTSHLAGVNCPLMSSSSMMAIVTSSDIISSIVTLTSSTTNAVRPTVAPLKSNGGSISNIVLFGLLLVLIFLVLLGFGVCSLLYIKNKIKKKKLLLRPLPSVTMSNFEGGIRYSHLEQSEDHQQQRSEVKQLSEEDEFPVTCQEHPYNDDEEDDSHYDKDPLYEIPLLKTSS